MSNTARIAMIGTGNIGGTLGRRLHAAGYGVVFGARDTAAAAAKLQNVDVPVLTLADGARRRRGVPDGSRRGRGERGGRAETRTRHDPRGLPRTR